MWSLDPDSARQICLHRGMAQQDRGGATTQELAFAPGNELDLSTGKRAAERQRCLVAIPAFTVTDRESSTAAKPVPPRFPKLVLCKFYAQRCMNGYAARRQIFINLHDSYKENGIPKTGTVGNSDANKPMEARITLEPLASLDLAQVANLAMSQHLERNKLEVSPG
jgi:hypothetical protein